MDNIVVPCFFYSQCIYIYTYIYTVSQKNVPPLVCYNFDTCERILIFFGRNVTDKVSSKKTLYLATSNNVCFCITTTVLRPFFWDHPVEVVPEENVWTLWGKRRLTKADTVTIQLGASPSGLTSAHLHHPPQFLQAGCPSCRPTNNVRALKATNVCFCTTWQNGIMRKSHFFTQMLYQCIART